MEPAHGCWPRYEVERRPIGLRNVKASRAAMVGRLGWRAAYNSTIWENTPEGAATRAEMAKQFDTEQRKVTEILGIEAGHCYVNSPVVWPEAGDGPDPDNPQIHSNDMAGRAPAHMFGWTTAARCTTNWALAYTQCFELGKTSVDTEGMEQAASKTTALRWRRFP